MNAMSRLRSGQGRRAALVVLCLALSLSGCARSEPLHRTDASPQASEQKLPFHPDAVHDLASDGTHPAVSPDPKSASGLPFRASHPRILAPGTLLTVQLEKSVSTAKVRAGDAFTASVAAPITLDGDTLIKPGTVVSGRIESAQSQPERPGLVPRLGYFRLTLTTITVDGRPVALQTSSLFARGAVPQFHSVRVPKGRHLTFRLTAPVVIDDPTSLANRQSSEP
jgi:hypothetical protein